MPDWRAEVRRRLAGTPGEREIADEIVQHLEDRHDDLVARGIHAAEAERLLVAELDGGEGLAARFRGVARSADVPIPGAHRRGWLADLWHDLRYAARALAKNRGFTAVTLLSLALGIGANTALFQLIDALHLRALPVADPDELALVSFSGSARVGHATGTHPDLTYRLWEQIRDRQDAFSGMIAWGERTFNMAPSGEASWARALMVSGGYFQVLGVPPSLGRALSAADDRRGCAGAAMVSHGFWQRALGGDPAVVGRKLSLDGRAVEIVGVTPPSFFGLEVGRSFDVALPLCLEERRLDEPTAWWLSVVGRLRPGWSMARAGAHLHALSSAIFEHTLPAGYNVDTANWYKGRKLSASPAATGISQLRREYSTPLFFLLGTAALVLIIACANLANLLLARASAREREIAVRLAIGASRGRLVRQLMTESLLLAGLGAAFGLLLARLLAPVVVAFLGTRWLPVHITLDPDWRVLAFTAGLAAVTCLLFGLVPALRASRADVGLVLKATGPSTTSDGRRFGLRRVLVAIQVALSFVLLFGALLFVRSLHNLVTVDPGFRGQGLLVLNIDARPLALPPERRRLFIRELLGRLRATPGVDNAAITNVLPISGGGWNEGVTLEGGAGPKQLINFTRVSTGYFQTLGTSLVAGRDFAESDDPDSPPVAIVNEELVRRLVPTGSPIGRRFRIEAPVNEPSPVYEIVGVVRDTRYRTFRERTAPIVFLPVNQDARPGMREYEDILIRSQLPLASVAGAVKQTVAEVAPRLIIDFDRLERIIDQSMISERLMATLAGFFGVLAALLAAIGLYGVVSYSVARRTREIGIRMALGAGRRTVSRMVAREAAELLAVGLLAGAALGLLAARAAAAMLYGLAPSDPLTLAMAAALMAAVALLASLLPARRAAQVDPIIALRAE